MSKTQIKNECPYCQKEESLIPKIARTGERAIPTGDYFYCVFFILMFIGGFLMLYHFGGKIRNPYTITDDAWLFTCFGLLGVVGGISGIYFLVAYWLRE